MKPARLYKQYRPARMPDPDSDTIETRILTALKTLRALPDPDAKFIKQFDGRAVSWVEVVREAGIDYPTEMRPSRFQPRPRDVSRMLGDLEWLNGIGRPFFRLIWWRSFEHPFSHIAARIGRSDETARRRYREAIMEVTKAAIMGEYQI